MKNRIARVFVGILCSALLLVPPAGAVAESSDDVTIEAPTGVIISEVQTGNAARADEFIELYNATNAPLDLTGWQVRYITASATSAKNVEDPSAVVTLAPPADESGAALVPAGGYYLLYSGAVALPQAVLGQQYDGMLPATGGSLVLVSPDSATCEFVFEDALAWGNTTHLFGEGESLAATSSSSSDRLYQRYVISEGTYLDTGDNAADFQGGSAAGGLATPGAANTATPPEAPVAGSGMQSQALPERFTNPDCTLPPESEPEPEPDPPTTGPESPPSITEPPQDETEGDDPGLVIPASNVGLKPPLLSELLPNPAAPLTDKDDEFIELYNPNDQAFDLSGYTLEVGLKTKKHYAFPDGTSLPPRAFVAFFAADTNLALSNSGSQVVLMDPLGTTLAISEVYSTAKDGQSWVLANGAWQWTTKPTPNALNVVSAPPVKAAKSSAKKKANPVAAVKSASAGGQSGQHETKDLQQVAAVTQTNTPLHPGVLAVIAVSAILYGAYEYRQDVANRLYQFRTNRAARRAARQSAEGR